jgi:hypothetical protein
VGGPAPDDTFRLNRESGPSPSVTGMAARNAGTLDLRKIPRDRGPRPFSDPIVLFGQTIIDF